MHCCNLLCDLYVQWCPAVWSNCPFKEQQLQDAFQYLVYPWMMALLYTVSGMTVRYYMEKHNLKEFIRDKTRKLLVPSTVGLFVFQWILGYYNMKISGAFESFESVPGIVRYVIMAISGIGVLWYIQVLWIFSMLLLLVRKIERDRIWKKGEKTCLKITLYPYVKCMAFHRMNWLKRLA